MVDAPAIHERPLEKVTEILTPFPVSGERRPVRQRVTEPGQQSPPFHDRKQGRQFNQKVKRGYGSNPCRDHGIADLKPPSIHASGVVGRKATVGQLYSDWMRSCQATNTPTLSVPFAGRVFAGRAVAERGRAYSTHSRRFRGLALVEESLRRALDRDPCDAANDAEVLYDVLCLRASVIGQIVPRLNDRELEHDNRIEARTRLSRILCPGGLITPLGSGF